jgi:hypothetical protein
MCICTNNSTIVQSKINIDLINKDKLEIIELFRKNVKNIKIIV